MLIAMLIYYISSLFGGGSSDGLVKDIAKPVKEYVQDAAKVKQILAINKEMLVTEETFAKDIAKAKESLEELNGNRQTTAAEIVAIFADMDQKRAAAREMIVADRFKMQALMTAEEWRKVYAPVEPKP